LDASKEGKRKKYLDPPSQAPQKGSAWIALLRIGLDSLVATVSDDPAVYTHAYRCVSVSPGLVLLEIGESDVLGCVSVS